MRRAEWQEKIAADTAVPSWHLPTGWREATGAGWGGSRINEGLRGLRKADSLAA